MVTRSGFDPGKVEAARRVYAAMRNINLAGGRALEAHERVALLTVPAGLRPFCLLTHIEEADVYLASAVLPTLGLHCGQCNVSFDYDLEVDAPPDVIAAYKAYEAKDLLQGLGVATKRIEFGSAPLGIALGYPKCCSDMDESTKSHDRSAALRLLIEAKKRDFAAVKEALAGRELPQVSTDRKEAWDRRFDRTRDLFPFALHTACDDCIGKGTVSPTGIISDRYEALVRAASPELHTAVLRSCEIFRRTSRFLSSG